MPGALPSLSPVLYTGTQWLIIAGLVLVALGIKALIAWWLYRDATARERPPIGWVVASVFSSIGTLVVWLIARPARRRDENRMRAGPRTEAATAPSDALTATADPYRTGLDGMDAEAGAESLQPEDAAGGSFAGAGNPTAPPGSLTVTCPRCQNRVTVARNPSGPTPLRCDNCGATGRL